MGVKITAEDVQEARFKALHALNQYQAMTRAHGDEDAVRQANLAIWHINNAATYELTDQEAEDAKLS